MAFATVVWCGDSLLHKLSYFIFLEFPNIHIIRERCSNDNGTTSLPFSDRHNPNEAPRLPSPSHGDVACCVREHSNFVGYGGAGLIRDLGGIIGT